MRHRDGIFRAGLGCFVALVLVLPARAQLPASGPAVDGFAAPARERWLAVTRAYRALRGHDPEIQAKRRELGRRLSEATYEMQLEQIRLIKRLFAVRQAELEARGQATVRRGRDLGLTVMNYPRGDGSTSTHPLAVLIACRLLGADAEWRNPVEAVDGSEADPLRFHYSGEPAEFRLRARTASEGRGRVGAIVNRVLVVHHGTHAAYENIIKGAADFALIARRPSQSERVLMEAQGVQLDVVPVARDAFVFIVDRANPVGSLSTAQIKAIYTGQVENWRELGGVDAEIRANRRNVDSGSEELMRTAFMREDYEALAGIGPMSVALSMEGPFAQLAKDKDGIAYTVRYYQHFMAASPYPRALAVDGVRPTRETIASGTYPYVTEVYAVIRADAPAGSPARRVRDWLLTSEGQAVVAESGYVPLGGRR